MRDYDEDESFFVAHEPCPPCGSRNNLARYSDGQAHCFTGGCNYYERGDGEPETLNKFGYVKGKFKGDTCHIAPYFNTDGELVARHLRLKNKKRWLPVDG